MEGPEGVESVCMCWREASQDERASACFQLLENPAHDAALFWALDEHGPSMQPLFQKAVALAYERTSDSAAAAAAVAAAARRRGYKQGFAVGLGGAGADGGGRAGGVVERLGGVEERGWKWKEEGERERESEFWGHPQRGLKAQRRAEALRCQ